MKGAKMQLIKPDIKYKETYIAALRDGFYSGAGSAKTEIEIQEIEKDFNAYFSKKLTLHYNYTPRLRDDGKYYLDVPQITYWLIDNDEFIGSFALRTCLNDYLFKYHGGHIGYGITPRYRKKGYATKGLALLIEEAKKINISKLLITAKEENVGSWKAIEKNGGVFENVITLPWNLNGPKYKRYWIDVP